MFGLISAGLGIASSALGSYGQYQQQQAAYSAGRANTRAANRYRTQQYHAQVRSQQRQWQQALKIRELQVQQYNQQLTYNYQAAGRAYTKEYERSAQAFENARNQGVDNLKTLVSNEGKAAAAGRTGRGVARKDKIENLAQYGQAQALIADNLTRSVTSTNLALEDQRGQLERANYAAWVPVSAPLMTPDPIMAPQMQAMPQAPSSVGLIGSAIGGIGSAIGSFQSLQAPKAYTGSTGFGSGSSSFSSGWNSNAMPGINYNSYNVNSFGV